jgi:hypothetical protein
MFLRKDLDDVKLKQCGSGKKVKKSAVFDAAKKKALEAVVPYITYMYR